ncbi:MAG: 1-deoxy-D-xylulose-5-phosphate synthase, partial [Selenomonadaceae bacterium]|nr:1-deoxy-D-xylulose-5-phosphate synthase [Selenomonadaceae bacterium]
KIFVTIEEGTLSGGYGSAVAEFLADENISARLLRFGIKDKFVEHGTRAELLEICGLTAKQIAGKILEVRNFVGAF